LRIVLASIFALCTFVHTTDTIACDVCGTSVIAQSMGLLPGFQKYFAGIRYSHGKFISKHPGLEKGEIVGESNEQYDFAELRGRAVLAEKYQLMVFVPFGNISKNDSGVITQNSGLGDISLLGNYLFINHNKNGKKHTLLGGMGVKLPTGSSNQTDNKYNIWIPNLQLGTGSWDMMLNLNYIYVDAKNQGVLFESFARLNSSNSQNYRFGNRYAANLRYFYKFNLNEQISIVPSIGSGIEYMAKDYRFGLMNSLSGGYTVPIQAGLDLFLSDWNLSFTYLNPILHSLSDGYVFPRNSFQIQLHYLF
jgi:hypothetical protein